MRSIAALNVGKPITVIRPRLDGTARTKTMSSYNAKICSPGQVGLTEEETIYTPVPWDRSSMEWRRLIGSPYCDLTPTQKHVLTVMCRYGKKWGEDIFPSQRSIAFRSGVSLGCVNNTMKTAEKQGWIIRNMLSNGRGYKRSTYQLAYPAGVADATAFMKAKFWDPPYVYEIVRCDDQITVVKLEEAC